MGYPALELDTGIFPFVLFLDTVLPRSSNLNLKKNAIPGKRAWCKAFEILSGFRLATRVLERPLRLFTGGTSRRSEKLRTLSHFHTSTSASPGNLHGKDLMFICLHCDHTGTCNLAFVAKIAFICTRDGRFAKVAADMIDIASFTRLRRSTDRQTYHSARRELKASLTCSRRAKW